jgi:hypothetical protein
MPDGRFAAASRIANGSALEIEAADDFILSDPTTIASAQFFGLLPGTTPISSISQLTIEIYRVFPFDSSNPPNGMVPTRVNSPSDVAFATRSSSASQLTFAVANLGPFSVSNSVLNGIHPIPNQTTGGEGPVSGTLVRFDVNLASVFDLAAGHYFFVPQVGLSGAAAGATFYWLSAPGPPLFNGDLQAWTRNANLDPNWLRIGTDVVGTLGPAPPPSAASAAVPPTFNMAFTLTSPGATGVPTLSEGALVLVAAFLALAGAARLRYRPWSG